MNSYRDIIEQARALQNVWDTSKEDDSSKTFFPEKLEAARAKLKNPARFIPTGIKAIDAMVKRLNPQLRYDTVGVENDTPFYNWESDTINLPPKAAAKSRNAYARTLVHELSHWVGQRVGRSNSLEHGDRWLIMPDELFPALFMGYAPVALYAREELTAELTTARVMETLAPEVGAWAMDYNLHYINAWIRNMESENLPRVALDTVLKQAAERAEVAAAYLLNPSEVQS